MSRITLKCLSKGLMLAATGLAAGCVTTADINARLDAWRGLSADELATVWGAPFGQFERQDGYRILSYGNEDILTAGAIGDRRMISRQCRINVLVHPAGKVVDITWSGSTDLCAKTIPMAGSSGLSDGNQNRADEGQDSSE